MALQIKKILKNDIDELKQLFDNTPFLKDYNPFHTGSLNEFEWQFFNEEYEECPYFVAYDNEKLIGTLAALIIPMRTPGGNVCLTIKPEDALINVKAISKYNGIDILSELLNKITEDTKSKNINILWGFTDAVGAFNRLGFKFCFKSKQGIYSIKPLLAFKYLIKLNPSNRIKQKFQIFLLAILSYFKTFTYLTFENKFKCNRVNFGEINEDILLSFLPKNLYCLYLNKEFINWRIIRNPSGLKYEVLEFKNENENIIAYLIYSIKPENVIFIEQMLFDDKLELKTKKKLVNYALKFFKTKNACIVRTMGFSHNKKNKEEMDILSQTGFMYVSKGISFILSSKNENIKCGDIYLSRLNMQGTN